MSQSYVSRVIQQGKIKYGVTDLRTATGLYFSAEEIQYLQSLPREIIKDMELIAFVVDILGIRPLHPFYQLFESSPNVRIAALSNLGVQNKHLEQIFKKNQPTISMVIKRGAERAAKIEKLNRYDFNIPVKLDYVRENGLVVNKTY
jgi:hypothetical protein